MSYEVNIRAIAERASASVERLWAAHLTGDLSLEDFVQSAAIVIATARGKGVTLAQLTLTGYVQTITGRIAEIVAESPLPATDRLHKALVTITGVAAVPEQTVMQLGRLASAEVLEGGAQAFSRAIEEHPQVEGWTRGLEGQACEMCRWWHRDGRVWPANHHMPTHKGCACTPVPVVANHPVEVSRAAFHASEQRAKTTTQEN